MAKKKTTNSNANQQQPQQQNQQHQRQQHVQNQRVVSLTEDEVTELSDGHSHCLVCYGDLTFRGKLPCGHDDICGVCHLRMRYLHGDTKCPICKQSTEEEVDDDRNGDGGIASTSSGGGGGGGGGGGVIVDHDPQKKHSDYPRWGDDIGTGFVHRKDVGMFFREDYYNTDIIPFFAYACNQCDFQVDQKTRSGSSQGGTAKNSPQRLLLDHLRTEHRLAMCYLCIDHKRDFISQLPRYSPTQLQKHLKEEKFGHPLCAFCKPKRFYDNYHLHQHLHKEHYKCHVCEKQGRDNQWFKHYGSLQRHFDQQHFLCHNPQCLDARFVVFENELDLRGHELSVHGGSSTGSTKINLEFRTRRQGFGGIGIDDEQQRAPDDSDFNYDLDGQAFVPDGLSSQSGNQTTRANNQQRVSAPNAPSEQQLHPLHVQRTEELRAHAAQVRRQQAIESQVESFPTLQSSTAAAASSSAPLVGWASGASLQRVNQQLSRSRVGQVTEESFPALRATQSNNNNKNSLNANIGATRRQFAAMNVTSNQPSWNGGRSAATAAAAFAPPASASFIPNIDPTQQAAPGNRQSDLAPNNFPALAPSSLAASQRVNQPSILGRPGTMNATPPSFSSMADFPSMASSSMPRTGTLKKPPPQQQQSVPSLDNAADFPPPPSAMHSSQSSVRQRLLGNDPRGSPGHSSANFLQGDISAAAKASIDDMKASLGQKKFKQLKKLTRDFAEGGLSPEGYVDQSAVLFDRGYADPDFWGFLPSLLESCPNEAASQHALQYMSSLKRQQFMSPATTPSYSMTSSAPSGTSWSGSSMNSSVMRPPPTATPAPTTGRAAANPNTHLIRPAAAGLPNTIKSNKKSAWGAGGTTSVVRAKAPPGSVSAAAASQGPQSGTATKYMAKEKKKQEQQQATSTSNGKKNSKKQNNELRALAFGR